MVLDIFMDLKQVGPTNWFQAIVLDSLWRSDREKLGRDRTDLGVIFMVFRENRLNPLARADSPRPRFFGVQETSGA